MADNNKKIKKIKLSDGSIYSIFDEGALRLNENKILVTGNSVVDQIIIRKGLSISEVDDIPIEQSINNVLVQGAAGKIMTRSTNELLKDIGGVSCKVQGDTFIIQVGKIND